MGAGVNSYRTSRESEPNGKDLITFFCEVGTIAFNVRLSVGVGKEGKRSLKVVANSSEMSMVRLLQSFSVPFQDGKDRRFVWRGSPSIKPHLNKCPLLLVFLH